MSWGGGRNSEFRIVNSEWGHYVAVSRGVAVGVESLSFSELLKAVWRLG